MEWKMEEKDLGPSGEDASGALCAGRVLKFRAWNGASKRMTHLDPRQWSLTALTPEPFWEVMQFTGLKDKNGREIYEGDIIEANITEYSVPTMGVIRYSEQYQAFANFNDGGVTLLFKLNNFMVIGNIYENPELIGHL